MPILFHSMYPFGAYYPAVGIWAKAHAGHQFELFLGICFANPPSTVSTVGYRPVAYSCSVHLLESDCCAGRILPASSICTLPFSETLRTYSAVLYSVSVIWVVQQEQPESPQHLARQQVGNWQLGENAHSQEHISCGMNSSFDSYSDLALFP